MSMISPEIYLKEFKEKSRTEMVKETRKLRSEIMRLEEMVKNNTPCFTKPSFETQLHYSKLYENEIIIYYINAIFNPKLEKDPTWMFGVRNFILACREAELSNLGLEELIKYFTIDKEFDNLKSYGKFEHFKKYNNKDINLILDCPAKTKLSYYNIMQSKLHEFPFWFNENKEVPKQVSNLN